jgi:hypothetical protein
MHNKFLVVIVVFFFIIDIPVYSANIFSSSTQENIEFRSIDEVEDPVNIDKNDIINHVPTEFTKNCGQLENKNVRYYAQGGSLWFTDDGVWFEIKKEINVQDSGLEIPDSKSPSEFIGKKDQLEPVRYRRVILKQEFLGAKKVEPIGKDRLDCNSNFFYGNDPSKWCSEVPNYREVFYPNIYDNIDLRYYTNNNGLKYDFIVKPGGDVSRIRMKYHGTDGLKLDSMGNLVIETEIQDLVDKDLFIYQNFNQKQLEVEGKFILTNNNEYGFEVSNYNINDVLVIDPFLEFSTFLGGYYVGSNALIGTDSADYPYSAGCTNYSDFPTTPGAYNETINGKNDIFIVKLNKDGTSAIYSTFIGGKVNESCYGMKVDPAGYVLITGTTTSPDFPVTTSAYDKIFNGSYDSFVLKLNAEGSNLVFSTYLGGSGGEAGYTIEIDTSGYVYVSGYTYSNDFPTTPGAYNNTLYGSSNDFFLSKFNPGGSLIEYSTYFGGEESEYNVHMKIGENGLVYLGGNTRSHNFPTTPGALDTSFDQKNDGCISILNLTGSGKNDLIYSTYIGGYHDDYISEIFVDAEGCIYAAGSTCSQEFKTTENAFDNTFNGGTKDIFVLKLDPQGAGINDLIFSTFIGGERDENVGGLSIDSYGNILIAGETNSVSFPVTQVTYDNSLSGWVNAIFCKLNEEGSALLYSTYIGGKNAENVENGENLEIDSEGYIYISGTSTSSDFPTTPGAYRTSANPDGDTFIIKVSVPHFIFSKVSLYQNDVAVTDLYSRLCPYTFRVNIMDSFSSSDIGLVRLTLDPGVLDVHLMWTESTGEFTELSDPNDYVTLDQTSMAYNNKSYSWVIDFNVIFNWNYPKEDFNDISVYITSGLLAPIWINISSMFNVENDVNLIGTLSVKKEDNTVVQENDLVKGGVIIKWSGLKVAYESANYLYPPSNETNITVWDSLNNPWTVPSTPGVNFYLETITPLSETPLNDIYVVNITGIPPESDVSDVTFTLKIDNDNVTFSNPVPEANTWHSNSKIKVGVTITDQGGGVIDGDNVMYTLSTNNGSTWGNWKLLHSVDSETTVNVEELVDLEDGINNLIKWKASDILGNGPVESESYPIWVDTEPVIFTKIYPLDDYIFSSSSINFNIEVKDNTSGVNGSSIEYSTSEDNGETWSDWEQIIGLKDNLEIEVDLKLTFPNGTDNFIKFQASDIAGNGPFESTSFNIKINTWIAERLKTNLLRPKDQSKLATTSVKLSWELDTINLENIHYDIYLDTINPPLNIVYSDISDTSVTVTNLIDTSTYYWTIIPKSDTISGSCLSAVWSFTIDITSQVPEVQLIAPEDGTTIYKDSVKLDWEPVGLGTDWIYDVYFDDGSYPPEQLVAEKLDSISFTIEGLEHGKTYFWTIVPISNDKVYGGYGEIIWSITVNFSAYGVDVDPVNDVYIAPGETKEVILTIINLGEPEDRYRITINSGELGTSVALDGPSEIIIEGKKYSTVTIQISIPDSIEFKAYLVNVSVKSISAEDLGIDVSENITFKVHVESAGSNVETEENIGFYTIIAVSIIVIIIMIIVICLFLKKKKQKPEPDTNESQLIYDNSPNPYLNKKAKGEQNIIQNKINVYGQRDVQGHNTQEPPYWKR